MKITIYEIPPSNNKYLGNSHNFNLYRREKERWHGLIRYAMMFEKKPEKAMERARVTITYHFKDKHRRDPDNYSGKMLLDPLVREGVLKDDSFSCVELVIRAGEVSKTQPRTEIEVEEL